MLKIELLMHYISKFAMVTIAPQCHIEPLTFKFHVEPALLYAARSQNEYKRQCSGDFRAHTQPTENHQLKITGQKQKQYFFLQLSHLST